MDDKRYIDPRELMRDEKSLKEIEIEGTGDGQRNNPKLTRIGDITITGAEYGDKPIGLSNPKLKPIKRSDRKGYRGFTLPGTAGFIRRMVDAGKKEGGKNPAGWDEGDIGLLGRFLGVTVEDLENRETDLRRMNLKEEFKNTRMAGDNKAIQIYWGDTDTSVRKRLEMAQNVANAKRTEPRRVANDRQLARAATETANSAVRSENAQNIILANSINNRLDDVKYRADRDKVLDEQAAEDRRVTNLRYEEGLRRDLRQEAEQIKRDERRYDFEVRKYEDMLDYREKQEEKDKQRFYTDLVKSVVPALGDLF